MVPIEPALETGRLRHLRRLSHLRTNAAAPPTIAIVTQCSFDRLPALERLARAWDGVTVCALLLEDRVAGAVDSDVSKMFSAARKTHAVIQTRLLLDVYRRSPADAAKPYPINALRNAALSAAATIRVPLVLILDVDCVPSEGALAALVGDPSRAAALLRPPPAASTERRIVHADQARRRFCPGDRHFPQQHTGLHHGLAATHRTQSSPRALVAATTTSHHAHRSFSVPSESTRGIVAAAWLHVHDERLPIRAPPIAARERGSSSTPRSNAPRCTRALNPLQA